MSNNQHQLNDLEGFRPARETTIEIDARPVVEQTKVFAVCLETDDPTLLVPLKVYEINLRGEYARIIDEAGEVAVYPLEYFLALSLPQEQTAALSIAQTKIAA